jgi:hypothetical protein
MIVPKSYINNPKEFQSVIKMLLFLADQLPNYKMSQGERLKAEKERQVMENIKAKEAQKEKSEVINFDISQGRKSKRNLRKRRNRIQVPRKRKRIRESIKCRENLLKSCKNN